ncbi:hypothetical protein ACQYAD_03180 [Neobacillus sp. SM06]|uniref:hypothetical protein n=1 Tax=Neobacillus sp. SM06 TaxID=3422492 RepID=UPI003D29C481
MNSLLTMLTEKESRQLLHIIAEEDLSLAKKLEEKVQKHLLKINVDSLAAEVYQALDKLTLDDIYERPGSRRFKYVEPAEAAYEVIEETLKPFATQMDRFKGLHMLTEFKLFGLGFLKGVQTFLNESNSEIIEHISDDVYEWLYGLLMAYKKKSKATNEQIIIEELLQMI